MEGFKIKKIIKYAIILLLIVIMSISSYFFFINLQNDNRQEEIFEEIKIIAEENNTDKNETSQNNNINMQKLYNINNDIVAWIQIENSNIDYPVMQTKENPNYYLRKNFYKQYSYLGTPYLAENCTLNTSDNLIVYGHHINNAKMFGELENYKSEKYYSNHKFIKFYTLEEYREYEIIAVFKTIANTGFKYYNFINAQNKDEFDTFINRCKELSFFYIENTAIYGDSLLTLSTCDYSSKNARLVIIAKRIN